MKIKLTLIMMLMAAIGVMSCGGGDDEPSQKPPVVNPENPGGNGNGEDPGNSEDPGGGEDPGGSEDPQGEITLSLSQSSVFWGSSSGKQSIIVNTNARSWTAQSDQAWCKTEQSGTMLNLSADANTGSQVRVAKVTVKAAGSSLERTVTVVQSAGDADKYILPTQAIVRIPSTGSRDVSYLGVWELSLHIQSNVTGWTCRVDQSWVEVRCDAGNVYVGVYPNAAMTERTAVITLSYEGKDYAQIFILQKEKTALQLALPDGNSLPIGGGSIRVKVYSNIADWEASVPDGCWFTITKTDAETLTLTCQKRETGTPRLGQEVTITALKETEKVVIYEAASYTEGYGYGEESEWDD